MYCILDVLPFTLQSVHPTLGINTYYNISKPNIKISLILMNEYNDRNIIFYVLYWFIFLKKSIKY